MRPTRPPDTHEQRTFIEQARRAQITDAAVVTVAEVGYAHASLAQIATRAGISKSVISYHFDGKDELMEHVAWQCIDQAWQAIESQLNQARTPMERIQRWVEAELLHFAAHREQFLAMIEIVMNHRRPDGSRSFDGLDEEETQALTDIVREGQRVGEVREADATGLARVIIQLIEGTLSQWAHEPSFDIAAHMPVLVDFIAHATRTENP